MKSVWMRFFGGYKGLLFILVMAIGLALHLYIQRIVDQLRDEAREHVLFYAQMYAMAAETDSPADLSFLFDQIISKTSFPLILTDPDTVAVSCKGIVLPGPDTSAVARHRLARMIEKMDREIDPVPVRYRNILLGYLYYGDSRLIDQLRLLPYVQIGLIGLFVLVGLLGSAHIKKSEERYIWVGMAKETAHQLGTPISSLMGWVEMMRANPHPAQDMTAEMEKDLLRLRQVTHRFSQIGSKPDLKKTDLKPVLEEVAMYIGRRIPQVGKKVSLSEKYAEATLVDLNPELFQWAIENIMKNALDAMDKEEGKLEIRLSESAGRRVRIEIEDNGRGMDERTRKRAFKPGYTTKKRGWGLGLSLAKRIIEDYHGGRLLIQETHPGTGTVMRIELKGN